MTTKMIEGIKPYNDIFYKSCFYNSFFSITQWMNKSVYPHISNDLMVYTCHENSGALKIDYIPFRNVEDIFKEEGYEVEIKNKVKNVVPELIDSIYHNQPAIVWIDSFYEDIRPDLYGLEHWAHSLLVVGYREEERQFAVIEHTNRYSLNYDLRWISFDSLETAYNQFFCFTSTHEPGPSFYRFYNSFQAKGGKWSEQFIQNMYSNLDQYEQGIGELIRYVDWIKGVIVNPDLLQKHSNVIYSGINEIINAKQVEFMRYASFDQHPGRIDVINSLLEGWKNLRVAFTRYYFSRQNRMDVLTPIIPMLSTIINLEKTLLKIQKER